MKKGKIISMPTTPEAQIRTRARSLPVEKCMVGSDWKESQMAIVIVSRKHTNGNVTYGMYLVDLLLKGVKDCEYAFNKSSSEFEKRFKGLKLLDCDYTLAHNIIYEGITFAENCGFEPCKDFTKTGIYILEEDSDDIPTMDIPLGEDGVPIVFVTPDNDQKREIAILEKTVGIVNFIVYHVDKDGNITGGEEDDNSFHNRYLEVVDEIIEIGVDEYLNKYNDSIGSVQMMALIDLTYQNDFGEPENEKFVETVELITKDSRIDFDDNNVHEEKIYADTMFSILDNIENDKDAALADMEALMSKYPDDIDLVNIYINMLLDLDRNDEVERLTRYWYERAGDNIDIRLLYAQLLVDLERFDEIVELFGNQPGLNAITSDDVKFNLKNIAEFCACYVYVWLSKGDIEKAEPYYRLLLVLNLPTPFILNAMQTIINKKREAIMEKINNNINIMMP